MAKRLLRSRADGKQPEQRTRRLVLARHGLLYLHHWGNRPVWGEPQRTM